MRRAISSTRRTATDERHLLGEVRLLRYSAPSAGHAEGDPTAHVEHLPMDVVRSRRAEVVDPVGGLVWSSGTAKGNELRNSRSCVVGNVCGHARLDHPECDGVDVDL